MTKFEIQQLFSFNAIQRMGMHATMEDVEEILTSDEDHNLIRDLAELPFDISLIDRSSDLSKLFGNLREFVGADDDKILESYVEYFKIKGTSALIFLEACFAYNELQRSGEFPIVLYTSTIYYPDYGKDVITCRDFIMETRYKLNG